MVFTGMYFKNNSLKALILLDFIFNRADSPDLARTTSDISKTTGVAISKIRKELSTWRKRKYPYLKRLPKKRGVEYRYTITKIGKKYAEIYLFRMVAGFDLNLSRYEKKGEVRKMPHYKDNDKKAWIARTKAIMRGEDRLTNDEVMSYIGVNRRGKEYLERKMIFRPV